MVPALCTEHSCTESAIYMAHAFGEMRRLLEEGMLTDVVIVAGEKEIPAHRIVLAAASNYFQAMFTSDLKESRETRIEIKDVDPLILHNIIKYCYNGALGNTDLMKMLVVANRLQFPTVVGSCCNALILGMNANNCISILELGESLGLQELESRALHYLYENFMEVTKTEEFLEVSFHFIDSYLNLCNQPDSDMDVNVTSEDVIFTALLKWIKHDWENRKIFCSQIFSLVKLELVSMPLLIEEIQSHPRFFENPELMSMAMRAMSYQSSPDCRTKIVYPRMSTLPDLYVVGGRHEYEFNGIEKLEFVPCNFREMKCTYVDKFALEQVKCGVGVIGQKIYVVGGRQQQSTVDKVTCYTPNLETFVTVRSMSTRREDLAVAVLNGVLYAVGGYGAHPRGGSIYLSLVEKYNPSLENGWVTIEPMKNARSMLGVAVLNGKLYAVGGLDESALGCVECYSPETNKWSICKNMIQPRAGVGVGVIDGYIYAVGGYKRKLYLTDYNFPKNLYLDSVERYNPKTDLWEYVASIDSGRGFVGVCSYGERLFAVGGYDGESSTSKVEIYCPNSNTWKKGPEMERSRAGACVVQLKKAEK